MDTVRVKMLDGSIRDCRVTDWSFDDDFISPPRHPFHTRIASHVAETRNPIEAVISADFEYVERLA